MPRERKGQTRLKTNGPAFRSRADPWGSIRRTSVLTAHILEERVHHLGVKVLVGLLPDVFQRFAVGSGRAIGAWRDECVVYIRDRKDARRHGDLFALETFGVTASVPPLVVIMGDV